MFGGRVLSTKGGARESKTGNKHSPGNKRGVDEGEEWRDVVISEEK